jgi:hypothetical protein
MYRMHIAAEMDREPLTLLQRPIHFAGEDVSSAPGIERGTLWLST